MVITSMKLLVPRTVENPREDVITGNMSSDLPRFHTRGYVNDGLRVSRPALTHYLSFAVLIGEGSHQKSPCSRLSLRATSWIALLPSFSEPTFSERRCDLLLPAHLECARQASVTSFFVTVESVPDVHGYVAVSCLEWL